MNNIQVFSFYRNYFEIARYLQDKERLKIYDAILEYMFEDKEPELKHLLNGIWANIKMPLDNNKKNINNGIKGGRPKAQKEPKENPNNNPKETQKKPNIEPKGKANNIYSLLFIIYNYKFSNNINKLLEEYLEIRRKNKYTLTESVINRLCNKLNEYGKTDKEKEQIILNAINGGWKDFYELKKDFSSRELAEKLSQDVEQEIATDEEIKKLEERMKRT